MQLVAGGETTASTTPVWRTLPRHCASEGAAVKIFISYRRGDTAGRTGRLFDALVGRFGARNVFQDVTAIAPGTDFTRETTDAIGRCDVALIVIGSDWLTITGPTGRRLDDQNDHVRKEVAVALSSGVPVVPVLVGGAAMPSADDLPDDLASLVQRQAVIVRDDMWHQDVDSLVRHLRRDDMVGRNPRRWPMFALGAAMLALTGYAISSWPRVGGDDAGDASGELERCPEPQGSWTLFTVADDASATTDDGDARLEINVQSAAFDDDQARVFLQIEVRNTSDPGSTSVPYFSEAFFHTVTLDGLAQGKPRCLSLLDGDPNLDGGKRVIGMVGFDMSDDPTDRPLVLELLSGDPDIAVTR